MMYKTVKGEKCNTLKWQCSLVAAGIRELLQVSNMELSVINHRDEDAKTTTTGFELAVLIIYLLLRIRRYDGYSGNPSTGCSCLVATLKMPWHDPPLNSNTVL